MGLLQKQQESAGIRASLVARSVKSLPTVQETWVRSLGWEDPLQKEMATHSSILAWKMPWTEEPGRLQFIASHRVKHYWYDLACIHTWGQNVYTGLGWLKVLRSVGWVKFICIKIPEASWERVYSSGSESLVQTQCLKNWKGKAILKQPHVYPSNYFPVPVSSCLSTQKMELEIKWMR